MTSPTLAVATEFGRLYHRPGLDPLALPEPRAALAAGLLMPSVTNVIDVLDKPHLPGWYGREAAKAAVEVERTHPGLIAAKPAQAREFLAAAAERLAAAAAALGDVVHNAVETLADGDDDADLDELPAKYVASWRAFIADHAVTFVRQEATCFGHVLAADGTRLDYAGTADAIVTIGGKTYVIDYKTGKSLHTEAGLQLTALSRADEVVTADGTGVEPLPRINGALAVHLTADGYVVRPVVDMDRAWETFQLLRRVWDFHAENVASRQPLLLGPAWPRPSSRSAA